MQAVPRCPGDVPNLITWYGNSLDGTVPENVPSAATVRLRISDFLGKNWIHVQLLSSI